MTAFDSDRPAGYEENKRKYPYIHPEDLKPSERLAIDADAVEDFIEHYAHHKDHLPKHNSGGHTASDHASAEPAANGEAAEA